MENALLLTMLIPILLLLLLGALPTWLANSYPAGIGRVAMGATTASLICTLLAIALKASLGWDNLTLTQAIGISLYIDALTLVMMLLIAGLGLVIVRYTQRYLQAETNQGRFFRWLCFTLGCVMLLVVSGHLILTVIAWVGTSFGLHQLLTHYHDRPGARWAARHKFVISRVGDAFLLAALLLTWFHFGSLDYAVLFAQASQQTAEGLSSWLAGGIALLLVLGAMTKSAQFPFHSWLPDTMDTPTPVSALMHAGIINAGGFLVIRLSPLIHPWPAAMLLLAAVGALTAIFASVVMMTQTSIKRSLAYSTIAQMGFMMLECGLGLYAIAVVHLVAHSIYKAHAFLSSGTLLPAHLKADAPQAHSDSRPLAWLVPASLASAAMTLLLVVWPLQAMGKLDASKALLTFILALAILQLILDALACRQWRVTLHGLGLAIATCCLYLAATWAGDQVHPSVVMAWSPLWQSVQWIVLGVIAAGFVMLLALQVMLRHQPGLAVLQRMQVHASNGFYTDLLARKVTGHLWHHGLPAR